MNFMKSFANPFQMLGSFLHPEDAYKHAQKAAQHGYNEAQGYQQPYYQHGLDQYDRLNSAENKLLDPAALQSEWSKGYETSPYAQQLLGMNQQQGLDSASSMGLMGSSAAMGNIQQGAGNIVQKDRQQYLDDLMKKYMGGIGLGEDMYNTGAQAGGSMADRAMNQGINMGNLKYGEYAAPGKLFENLFRTGAGFAAGGAGGGAMAAGQGGNQYNQWR